MYVPKIYKAETEEVVFEYIKQNNFATLIGQLDHKTIASHIPTYLSEEKDQKYLIGHVAIQNDLKHCFNGTQKLLAIFMNTHAYVSSSWYSHINVPTWNYIAVHVYGYASTLNETELSLSLQKLVEQHEKDREPRFTIEQMEEQNYKRQLKGIIGFKLSIDSIEASYKLSQNRNDQDYKNIIDQLEKSKVHSDQEVAHEMKNIRIF